MQNQSEESKIPIPQQKPEEVYRKIRESVRKRKGAFNYDEELIFKHHLLMRTYGWISLKEFLETPISTVNNLIQEIIKDNEREKEAIEKSKRKK